MRVSECDLETSDTETSLALHIYVQRELSHCHTAGWARVGHVCSREHQRLRITRDRFAKEHGGAQPGG